MARLKDGSTVGDSEILTEGNLESLLGYLPLDPTDLTWDNILNKPKTFAPSTHSHAWSTITSKPSTFTPSTHTHSISDVTGLRAELDSVPELTKANVGLGNVDNVKQASKTEHDQLASNYASFKDDITSKVEGARLNLINSYNDIIEI